MKQFIFILLGFGLASFSFSQAPSFFYTSLVDCAPFLSSEWDDDNGGDYYAAECPALGGYRLFYLGGDARSWLELSKDGQSFSFAPWDLADAIEGFFPYVKGDFAEWRLSVSNTDTTNDQPKLATHALIYRMAFSDLNDETKEIDRLIVLRLEPTKVCYLGSATTNEEARLLADDLTKACL